MKTRSLRIAALLVGGLLFGIFPGCVDVFILNLATPFLLTQ